MRVRSGGIQSNGPATAEEEEEEEEEDEEDEEDEEALARFAAGSPPPPPEEEEEEEDEEEEEVSAAVRRATRSDFLPLCVRPRFLSSDFRSATFRLLTFMGAPSFVCHRGGWKKSVKFNKLGLT